MATKARNGSGMTTVAAVERALAVLTTFRPDDDSLSLAELHTRTGMYKSTLLRLLLTLEKKGFVVRLPDGGYQLGPANFHLGMMYRKSFRLEDLVVPALRDLTDATGESTSFFVANERFRTCLYRIECKQPIRHHTVEVGEPLPLGRGVTGKVLTLFAGGSRTARPELFEQLPITSMGKSALDISVVSGPVFGVSGELKGAISVSWPASRLDERAVRRVSKILVDALARLTARLGGDDSVFARAV